VEQIGAVFFKESSEFVLGGFIVLLRQHRGKNHHQFIIVHFPVFGKKINWAAKVVVLCGKAKGKS
jgi:hypothetical protein